MEPRWILALICFQIGICIILFAVYHKKWQNLPRRRHPVTPPKPTYATYRSDAPELAPQTISVNTLPPRPRPIRQTVIPPTRSRAPVPKPRTVITAPIPSTSERSLWNTLSESSLANLLERLEVLRLVLRSPDLAPQYRPLLQQLVVIADTQCHLAQQSHPDDPINHHASAECSILAAEQYWKNHASTFCGYA